MKVLWSGSIQFGLVNIPVNVYPASQERRLDFDYLHQKDLSPIGYMKICKKTGKEVPREEIVRGYEFRPGDYVLITDEDIKNANVKKTQAIEIIAFIAEKDIPVQYFEKPFYIEPAKGSEKIYTLLREALKKSGKIGLARFVLKTQEHLGVVIVEKDALLLNQIRYLSELRTPEEIKLPKEEKISEKELHMAMELIDQLSDIFQPEEYHDTYIEDLKKTIKEKTQGKKHIIPKEKEMKTTDVSDLMETLQRSLQHAQVIHTDKV